MKSTGLLVAVLMLVAVAGCASDKPPAHHGMDAGGDLGDAGAARDGSQAMLDADAATDASIDGSSDGITDAATHGGDVDAHLPTESDAGPASCRNGLTDRHETDIDCGGNECGPCLSGRHCELAVDCLSGKCESDGTCACKPLAACPAGACGVIHNCGSELDCGNCAAGVCYENQCCSPRKCKTGECGVISDGCGGTLRCGDESCCTPRTCDHPSLENRCGDFDDRCGGTVTCSCSDAKTTCYLGECCSPLACKDMGGTCGIAVSNGCGGTVSCGCGSDEKCYLGECCKPLTDCSTWAGPGCGLLADGCGGSLSCGCSNGESCINGSCCMPQACAAGNAGDACGTNLDDGCGGFQNCSCTGVLGCINGHCCQSQTCTERGFDQRCGPTDDTCGNALWCGCGQSNGMRVEQRNACGHACADTLTKVNTCNTNAALETLDQTAGWDFGASVSRSICNGSYGFSPNWTNCHNDFEIDAQGFVHLAAGTHCFSITGSKTSACGALYFVSTPGTFTGWSNLAGTTAANVVTGNSPVCFTLAADDYYPIRWVYTQDNWLNDFHVNYCAGGPTGCSPIPSSMLYPAQ